MLKLQNEIKASDVTVREGTTLVILANAPDNHSGYQDFRDFLAFNNNEKIYYEFAGWKDEKGDVHQIGDSVKVDDLSGDTDTTITLTATWEEIDPISEELYQKAADTLRLQVLNADSSFASPVLVTQWTDTDPNMGTNNKLTGNPVMLNEDNTLYYKMSAKLNSGLFGSSDPQHITKGDCVELTFSLDVDPNLEFADSETIQITYNNPNLKLESTNFGSVSGPDSDDNYVVTVNKSSLPINTDGGLHLEFTVKIINQSETLFNQQAGDPMEFSGFAFKLKDGVETDGLDIESTANVTGHMDLDKISNTGYHHRFRYYHVRSYLQGDEAQALFGEATDPTAFVHTMEFMDRKLANYDLSQDKMGYLQANTVKAYGSAVTIQPADITIYMGGEGYEGTVGSNGQLVTGEEQLKANGFPKPGFLITLPDALQDIDVTSELTLIYKGEDNKALYQWKFEKYGEGDHNIYRIVPMESTANRPVRMQFTIGENVVTDDQFNVAQYINQTLAMKVYGEGIEEHKVSFVYNDQEYPIAVEDGWMTVRGTTAGVQTAAVAAQEDFTAATGTPGVTAPAETTYTINNSPVQVDPEHTVALLFDGIIDDTLATMQHTVGGPIQAVYPFEEPVALICHEEGKLLHLPLNRALRSPDTGGIYNIIAGDFFLCAAPPDSEHFESLTDDQLERYARIFRTPELFLSGPGGSIMVLPLPI